MLKIFSRAGGSTRSNAFFAPSPELLFTTKQGEFAYMFILKGTEVKLVDKTNNSLIIYSAGGNMPTIVVPPNTQVFSRNGSPSGTWVAFTTGRRIRV